MVMMLKLSEIVIVSLSLIQLSYGQGCSVQISGGGLAEPQPLFIRNGTDELFLVHDRIGRMEFAVGEPIEMHCSVNFASPGPGQFNVPICESGTTFSLNGETHSFTDFRCTAFPQHTPRRTNRQCDNGNSIIIEIGFSVGNRFFNMMDVCHNEASGTNFWVYFKQDPRNQGFQRSFPRPGWLQGGFYPGLHVDTLYRRDEQEKTFARILSSDAIAKHLVGTNSRISISRGHMAAKADYIFGLHQRASFYFLNAAPQWLAFNSGNWERVESGVRVMVANRNISIDIYTGTYGIMTYPDVSGIPQKLYLQYDPAQNDFRIPVPKIYYKALFEPSTGAGIVLVGVNNPHISIAEIERDYVFCHDISDGITWLNWQRHNTLWGYSYACEFNEFARVVGHLPDLTVTSILI